MRGSRFQKPGPGPAREVLVRAGPDDGELVWQCALWAAGAHDVEHRVHLLSPPVGPAWRGAVRMIGDDVAGESGPGGVGQVGWIPASGDRHRCSRRQLSISATHSLPGRTRGGANGPGGGSATRAARRKAGACRRSGRGTSTPATGGPGHGGQQRRRAAPALGHACSCRHGPGLRRHPATSWTASDRPRQGPVRHRQLRGGRWRVSLNIETAELHPAARHQPEAAGGLTGVDRGLHAFAVAATSAGREVGQVDDDSVPKPLTSAMGERDDSGGR